MEWIVSEATTQVHLWKFHKELSAGIVSLVLLGVLARADRERLAGLLRKLSLGFDA